MGKADSLGDVIRRLVPRGVPMDVADDVARAARQAPPPRRSAGFDLGDDDVTRTLDEALAPRRGTQIGPEVLYDAHGRSLPVNASGWPSGTESFARPQNLNDLVVPPVLRGPDLALDSPTFRAMSKSQDATNPLQIRRTKNLRHQNPELAEVRARDIEDAPNKRPRREAKARREAEVVGGAVAAGVGGAAYHLSQPPAEPMSHASDTADLKAEQKPVPEVRTQEPESLPPTPESLANDPAPTQNAEWHYAQARELIDRLNQMRRNAGGEVPEARPMMAMIRQHQAEGDRMRNSPEWSPTDTGDPHQQAQMLIRQLNEMRRAAGGEVPQARQIMAEVRRLQAMGDAQRNSGYSRTGDFNNNARGVA